jgi:hypothetical protein
MNHVIGGMMEKHFKTAIFRENTPLASVFIA